MYEEILRDKKWINSVATRLYRKNPDYTYQAIVDMVKTAIWGLRNNITKKGVYCVVLERILEEKGFKYKDKELYRPIGAIDFEILNKMNIEAPKEQDYSIGAIMKKAQLTSEEMFVLACIYNIEVPIGEEYYQKILDNMPSFMYARRMKTPEIAIRMKTTEIKVEQLHKSAIKKMQEYVTLE